MRTPLALVALLVLTACSSSGATPASLESTPSPTTSASTSASAAPPGKAVPSTGAKTAPNAPPVTGSGGSTAAPGRVAPLTRHAPGKPAAQKATAAGVYSFDVAGTVTLGSPGTPQDASGTSTLTVSRLQGDVQHSTMHGDQGDTEENLLVRDAGTYAASLKLTSAAFTKEFRPPAAVLLVPDPAKVGAAWSWAGTSTDGKTSAKATNKIVRLETLTIGDQKVATAVLQTHLVLSGDIDYSTDITTWWAPIYRLPVKDHTLGKGTYNGFPFQTDITTVIRSVKPS